MSMKGPVGVIDRRWYSIATLLFLVCLSACKKDDDEPAPTGTGSVNNGWQVSQIDGSITSMCATPALLIRMSAWDPGLGPGDYRCERSSDEGASWTYSQLSNTTFPYGPGSAWFINDGVGFCNAIFSGMKRTNSGGSSWQDITASLGTVRGIAAASTGRIFSYGDDTTRVSFDGGSSWSPTPSVPGNVMVMSFLDPSNGFAAGASGISVTNDGGVSWQPLISGAFERFSQWDASHGAATVDISGTQTTLYVTNDGWSTSNTSDLPPDLTPPKVLFLDGTGMLYCSKDSHMYLSTDGGNSWHAELDFPSGETISRILRSGDHLIAYAAFYSTMARKNMPL